MSALFSSSVFALLLLIIEAQRSRIAELEEHASTDLLTGLDSRRYGLERIDREYALSARSNDSIALLFIDIDHFKRVNDTYSHDAGDQVLRMVARVIKKCIRQTDIAVRYGGEEMVVALPGMDRASARKRARFILKEVSKANIVCGRDLIKVTVSVGLAMARGGESYPLTISRADKAMYAAKKAGRNRMRSARL